MTTQLDIYNSALTLMGGRRLADLSEDREPKREFDAIWTNVQADCLEQAIWGFALRTFVDAVGTGLPTPAYGFEWAFNRPADCIHTYMLAVTPDMKVAEDVLEVDGLYLSHSETLYIRYTSNDGAYGLNLLKWTQSFSSFVSAYLASETCYRLTRNLDLMVALRTETASRLDFARSKDGLIASPGTLQYNLIARREFSAGDNPSEGFPFVTAKAPNGQA